MSTLPWNLNSVKLPMLPYANWKKSNTKGGGRFETKFTNLNSQLSIRPQQPWDENPGWLVHSLPSILLPFVIIVLYPVFLDEAGLHNVREGCWCCARITFPLGDLQQLYQANRPYLPYQNGCTCLISNSFTISHHIIHHLVDVPYDMLEV